MRSILGDPSRKDTRFNHVFIIELPTNVINLHFTSRVLFVRYLQIDHNIIIIILESLEGLKLSSYSEDQERKKIFFCKNVTEEMKETMYLLHFYPRHITRGPTNKEVTPNFT